MAQQAKSGGRRGGRKSGYVHKSNALHMTIYDAHGKPLNERLVQEFMEEVNAKALSNGLWFMYART